MNYKERISNMLLSRYAELKSWRKVAFELDVSLATVWRVANQGYEPKDEAIRDKLGFPQIIKQTVHRNPDGTFRKAGE